MTVTIKIPRDFLIVKFGGAAQGTAAGKHEGQPAQSTLRGSVQGLLRLNILHRRSGRFETERPCRPRHREREGPAGPKGQWEG